MEEEREIIPRKRVLTPRMPMDQPTRQPKPDPNRTAIMVYRPQDQSDPPEMPFGGIRFKANEPIEVSYKTTILQLITEKFETDDGIRSRAIERLVPLPDVLRGNPWFEIDGVRPERVKAQARLPDDADTYRGYCINWISVSLSADSMDKRWIGEEGLRQRCGMSPADIAYLRPFFEARHAECAELDRQRRVA